MTSLRRVDESFVPTRRVYVLPLDGLDFARDVTTMGELGYCVVNGDEDRLIDEIDLRVHLAALCMADDLLLPDLWWTSAAAHQLVAVAGWLGMKYVNQYGVQIETASARAK